MEQKRTRLSYWAAKTTDHWIAVSETSFDYLKRSDQIDSNRITLVNNAVDVEAFAPERGGQPPPEVRAFMRGKGPVIGTVTRFDPDKGGTDFFLLAAREVLKSFPDAGVLIVGDGYQRLQLEAMACDLNILRRTLFLGFRRDIRQLLACMDVFVLSSLNECLPINLLEAMAMAKPVVATHVGSVACVIDNHRNGLIVPAADSSALAEAIVYLAGNSTLCQSLGAEARRTVCEHFAMDRWGSEIETIYSRVMEQSDRKPL